MLLLYTYWPAMLAATSPMYSDDSIEITIKIMVPRQEMRLRMPETNPTAKEIAATIATIVK